MFIGHFALGFAAKRAAPTLSLATLFLAAQFADVLWPFLLAAGVEEVRIYPGENPLLRLAFIRYPYSHSLLFLLIWGALLGWIWRARTHEARVVPVLLLLVVSHWVLDVVTHRPDMPLYPGSDKYGLSLWESPTLTMAIEIPLYVAGVAIYVAATRARDRVGSWAFWALVLFLLVGYVGNLAGPPPPSVTAIYASGIPVIALLLAWAWWTDNHRTPRS
jgi:membrane-bound metal-dependent hydrolase YbcI (DUF457 family)